MLATIDMNLLIRIAIFILVFAFLLGVVVLLTRSPSFTVKENNVAVEPMVFSLLFFVAIFAINMNYILSDRRDIKQKGISMPTSIMVWIVIILVVVGLGFLVWAAVTGKLGGVLTGIWTRIFPF